MSTKIPATVAMAALALAALPALAGAAGPVELRLSRPGGGPSFDQLVVDARCQSACTLRLTELNTIPFRGSEQLPHADRGELGITRRLPAGKPVTIRFGVPQAVQGSIWSTLPRRATLFGSLAATVTTGGETYDVARQFTVVAPGGHPPFPPSEAIDAFVVSLKPPAVPRRARPPLYAMTVAGTQSSRWSYDRTSRSGSCTTLDSGSGTQLLRFRSRRAVKVRQLLLRGGARQLLDVAAPRGGVFVPIRIDAERDSSARKGMEGDCGDYGGDEPGTPACTRRGSVDVDMSSYFERNAFVIATSTLSWYEQSRAPDCPVETAWSVFDPIDLIDTPAKRGVNLSGGGARKVVTLSARDVTRLEGGSVTTDVVVRVTFRRLG